MPSDKTLAMRAREAENAPKLRILTQGPSSTEVPGLSVNRASRLAIERKQLTRKQRRELAALRRRRKFQQVEQAQPEWSKPQPQIGPAELARMMEQVQEEPNG